jgi:stress-induced morphogen
MLQRHQEPLNHTVLTKKHTQGIHALAVSTFIPEKEVQFNIARRLVVMLPN